MPMSLVDVVLGRNKRVLQRQLESFCAQYKSCLDVDGDMDRARREVSSVSRQLTTAQAKVTTEMLAGVTRAELLVMDVRERLSGLNTDAVRIVEAIRSKAKEFITILAQRHGHEQEDRQRLLEAFHIAPRVVPSESSESMVDLLTTEELRLLDKFVTSDVSSPEHQTALEDLTKQITVRVCQSFMEDSILPDEIITDPTACFERHLDSWQSIVAEVHEQHERLEKKSKEQRQLQRGIDSAVTVLGELTKLRDLSTHMCESLQAEIDAPGVFHALGRAVSFIWNFGAKSDAVKIKERELELRQDATRHIEELIATVNKTLAEARAEQEIPVDLERIIRKLDEVDGLLGNANESFRKVKDDLKAYEAAITDRIETRGNSFSWRWSGVLVTAAVGVVTTVVTPLVQARFGGPS